MKQYKKEEILEEVREFNAGSPDISLEAVSIDGHTYAFRVRLYGVTADIGNSWLFLENLRAEALEAMKFIDSHTDCNMRFELIDEEESE